MPYLNSIKTVDDLPRLAFDLFLLAKKSAGNIKKALSRASYLSGLGKAELAVSDAIAIRDKKFKQYNENLSDDEIRAWVWYRRSIGIPMTGWEKYFIADNTKQGRKTTQTGGFAPGCLVRTQRDTYFLTRDWKPGIVVPAGRDCGAWTGKEHKSNDNKTYLFCRDSEGINIVCKDDVTPYEAQVLSSASNDGSLLRLVKSGNLFYCDGELLPYPVYIYDNLYDRLLQLERDKDYIVANYGQAVYDMQKDIIKTATPKKLTLFNPVEKERPQILACSKFAFEFQIKISDYDYLSDYNQDAQISLTDAFSLWLTNCVRRSELQKDVAPWEIKNYYLRQMPVKGYSNSNDKEDRERVIKIKGDCRNEGERLFRRFLYEVISVEDRQKIDLLWNRSYNGYPYVPYDRVPVAFNISDKFKGRNLEIRPAQREAVAFMEITGSGIIAYDVGVGKTISAIIELASAIESGKCKRPLVVVPKSTYPNWIKEIIGEGEGVEGVLSGTGIKINDWSNLSRITDKHIKALTDRSITLVTYQGFAKIGFKTDATHDFLCELADILEDKKEYSARCSSQKYQEYAEMIGVGLKDTTCDIEDCRFDYIVIDEAHNFKNVFTRVRPNKDDLDFYKRRGYNEGTRSTRALKAFFLNNYIQRKFGRNVMLLTATPFTNSPIEIYSMLSHVAMQALKSNGYNNIGEFFEQFCEVDTEETINAAGKIEVKDVVRRFNNHDILQRLIYNHIDYKTGEESGVRRPIKVNLPLINRRDGNGIIKRLDPKDQVLTYLKMTEEQEDNRRRIVDNFGVATKGALLRAMNDSLNNALHPCLYNGRWSDTAEDCISRSPKLTYVCECIRSVKQWHEKRNEPVSGQVIYMNRGLSLIPFIKQYLIENVGFQKNVKHGKLTFDEVEVISGETGNRKEDIMVAFNAGVVKVIIGTKTICEGVNLQSRSTCLYNLYPDWNPTDIRQLEGRIWRQGNKFNFTRIVLPLVQDSMDVFVFQKIGEKTSRINDIWYRGTRGNVFDVDSLDPEEIKYALWTNVKAIAESVIDKEVAGLDFEVNVITDRLKALDEYKQAKNEKGEYAKNIKAIVKEYFDRSFDEPFNVSEKRYWLFRKSPELSQYAADEVKKFTKAQTLEQKIRSLLSKEFLSDEEVIDLFVSEIRFGEDIGKWRRLTKDNYLIRYFKKSVKQCKVIESSLFKRQQLAPDGIDDYVDRMNGKLDNLREEIETKKSDAYLNSKIVEVQKRKAEFSVSGQSPKECAEKFATLNYLMAYPFDPNNDGYSIPKQGEPVNHLALPPAKPQDGDKGRRVRLLRLKARAAKAKLKLLIIKG